MASTRPRLLTQPLHLERKGQRPSELSDCGEDLARGAEVSRGTVPALGHDGSISNPVVRAKPPVRIDSVRVLRCATRWLELRWARTLEDAERVR